jgi:hypothetical protein
MMLWIHFLQLAVSLLHFIEPLRPIKDTCIAFTKEQYGLLLVFISQSFAPTKIVLTVDESEDSASLMVTDKAGARRLQLPQRNGEFQVECLSKLIPDSHHLKSSGAQISRLCGTLWMTSTGLP